MYIDKNKILEQVDLKEALEFYGLEFNDKEYANCPFHVDKTPSLKINSKKRQYFTCFSCNRYGDIIGFVEQYFNLNFVNATQKIINDFRLDIYPKKLTKQKKIDLEENEKIAKIAKKLEEDRQDLLKEAVDYFTLRIRAYSKIKIPEYDKKCEIYENILDTYSTYEIIEKYKEEKITF